MARRLGHPEALATAIVDRHLAAMGRDDIEQRARAADELVALGQAAGRPDRVLVGLEWRYGAALARGDATAASLVLDEAEVLAALMPSPEWTYGVMLRRALLAAIAGDRDVALDLVRRARPLGDRALFAEEALGLEAGARTLVVRITGIADPDLLAVHLEFEQTGGVPAVPFFLVHSAAGALAVGDEDGATRIVRRVAERVCRSEEPAELPSTILLLGELVAELELGEYAEPLRRLCAPFHGFLTTESGFAVSRPADQTLAELALLAGDADAALRHVEACLAMVRAAPSPSYEARALWLRSRVHERLSDHDAARRDLAAATMIARRVGLVLPGAANRPFAAPKRASLTRDGATWRMTSPHGEAVVAHSIGIDQLAMVLAAAPREVLATDLALTGAPVAAPLGPALDTAAKQAYRRRIAALNAEIDEADRFHDIERAARARVELDALMQELRRAVGVHGRDRPMGSGAERARVNVARSLRRAISTVRAALPDLGAHLEVSVRTGRACAYAPEPGARLEWDVRRG